MEDVGLLNLLRIGRLPFMYYVWFLRRFLIFHNLRCKTIRSTATSRRQQSRPTPKWYEIRIRLGRAWPSLPTWVRKRLAFDFSAMAYSCTFWVATCVELIAHVDLCYGLILRIEGCRGSAPQDVGILHYILPFCLFFFLFFIFFLF